MRTVFGSTVAPSVRAVFTILLTLFLAIALQVSVADDADAKKRKRYKSKKEYKKVSRPNPRYAGYVIDAKNGKVLYSSNAHAKRYPASLTKMMTLYLMFEDLKAGRIKKSDRVVMTRAGWRRPPSKIGLRVGGSISVEQAILSLVTKSANDVATAVADKLGGNEAKFAKRMTRKARQLGMKNTTFKNASGLTQRGQLTTAADMARLGLALREHFPRRYRYFQTRLFKLGKRRYGNHNKLLGRVRGVDGIKTGYTRASGFNLVSSVSTGNRRIVAVVMGGRTGASRNAHMRNLIRRYLPKASRGGQKRLIARATSSKSRTKAAVSKRVSQKANKAISARVSGAHKKITPPTKKEVVQVQKSIRAMAANTRPTPQLRRSLDALPKATIDKTTTATANKQAAVKPTDGYQIQLAASDDKQKAMEFLANAKSKNRRLLANASPYTERVVKKWCDAVPGSFRGLCFQAIG